MTGFDSLKLTIPNDLSYLDISLNFIRETALKFGFSQPQLGQLELAGEEAIANVIKHAFEKGEHSTFDIICERTPLGIKVVIKDKGIPFDPTLLTLYDPAKVSAENRTAGMGVFLMKQAVDMVSFVNLGIGGKETRLIKYLPHKNIEEYFPGQKLEVEDQPPAPAPIMEKIPYDVRRMRPEEAIEVSRCAYKSHGYSFFDDNIYFPERLAELNRSEELISLVAVTKDNVFMGHSALHYPHVGAKIAELTFAFVNMEYRGQGCMTRLCEQLFDMEKRYPLTGVYANAVTNHLFTQKVLVKYAINDCGVYLAASPGTWVFRGISGESKQRLSVILSFKYLNPPQPLTIYPPARHRAMVEKLYKNIGAEHDYRCPEVNQSAAIPEKSSLKTDIYSSEECAEIWVEHSGSDLIKQVSASLHDLRVKQLGAIYLYLSLEDQNTCSLAPELEKLGFFFAGILPQTDIGDTLILQYLNNIELDYAKIQVLTNTGRELLDYVRALDPNLAAP